MFWGGCLFILWFRVSRWVVGVRLVVYRLVWWGGLPGGTCLGLMSVGLVGMVGVVLLLALRWCVSSLWVGGLFGCLLLG